MSEQNENRRKLLKSIAAGSGAVIAGKSLPESWSKPVVDSVILPVHAQTSPCTPCLVAATYCAGSGNGTGGGSIDIAVSINGTVSVDHSGFAVSPQTDSVDPCAGGAFSVTANSSGTGTITVSGTIPCGATSSIAIVEDDGTGIRDVTATQANCP